jgi:hypothetical protein
MQTFIYCNVKHYMFRASQRPSTKKKKTVSATSGIGHGIGTTTSFHRGLIPNRAMVEGSSGTNIVTYTRGSRYSFWNSWGWALWRPKHVEFDVAVNKCLHTDASSWSFLLILVTHLHVVPRSRMSGSILLFPLHDTIQGCYWPAHRT